MKPPGGLPRDAFAWGAVARPAEVLWGRWVGWGQIKKENRLLPTLNSLNGVLSEGKPELFVKETGGRNGAAKARKHRGRWE